MRHRLADALGEGPGADGVGFAVLVGPLEAAGRSEHGGEPGARQVEGRRMEVPSYGDQGHAGRAAPGGRATDEDRPSLRRVVAPQGHRGIDEQGDPGPLAAGGDLGHGLAGADLVIGRLEHREGGPGERGEVGGEVHAPGPVDPHDVGPPATGHEGIRLAQDVAVLDRGAHQAPLGPRVLEEGSDREGKGPVRHEGHLIRTGTDPGSHGLPGRVPEQGGSTALAVEPPRVCPPGVCGRGPGLPGCWIQGLPGGCIEESGRWGGG